MRKFKSWIAMAVAMLVVSAGAVFADPASDKAAVDAAKAAGLVGEQGDGYLGFVSGNGDAALTSAVNNINNGRATVYAETASKSGVSRDAAGQATGAQLTARVPPGQYYKPLGGNWIKK
jgi:uncharacterized protein YdbL (DUF1318 family)